jgi:hypothetical protein
MSQDLDQQRSRDQRILSAAKPYRDAYRTWRRLERIRQPTIAEVEERLEALARLTVAERAFLSSARGE